MKRLIHEIIRRVTHPAIALAFGIATLCVVLQVAGLDQTLRFDRDAIANGQFWLLLSGNFVHLGASHLFMNMAGLALVVALVWSHYTAFEWVLITIFSSLVVGVSLYLFDSEVFWYVGFSGTLHALVIAGSIADLRHYPKSAALLLILIIGKLAWEQVSGALPGSESVAGGSVVVNAHLYGAIGGAVAGVLLLLLKRYKRINKVNAVDENVTSQRASDQD